MGPKNSLERRAWQSYTICDKNQGLKVKNDEVTANLVPRSAAGQLHLTSGSAQKFVWGCMVDFQKFSCNSEFTVHFSKTAALGTKSQIFKNAVLWPIVW
jgi:hypothetical protein